LTIKALIFGSVGTLTETSALQRQAFNAAFSEAGLDWYWDRDVYADLVAGEVGTVGGAARIAQFARQLGVTLAPDTAKTLHAAKSRHYQAAMRRDGLAVNAGVVELIADAKAQHCAVAFASTTSRANIDALLAATRPPITDRFDQILSGEDAARVKPAPDIYIEALRRLDIAASDAVAIEDSPPSLQAARAAGIRSVLVPGTIWVGRTGGEGVPSLSGYTVAMVKAAAT
jgi:HAD superfamily hydrolase (TIGR01509 family)